MPNASSSVMHAIRIMAGAYKEDGRNDEELLSRYVATRDDAAFGTLMVRHGPMVWGICNHILDNLEDVEDAYQVVMLALANKADRIKIRSVAGWLHQVARQTALDARKAIRSRKRLQDRLKKNVGSEKTNDEGFNAPYERLHEELAKLPEKQRLVLVLHYLEGKTQTEVAGILGVKESAVRGRLGRGVTQLQKRLSQQGFVLGATSLGAMLAESVTQATMPVGLVSKTLKAASAFRDGTLTGGLARLAQGALKHTPCTIPWWKRGWIIAILCSGALGIGASGMVWRTGFFGTKADGRLLPSNRDVSERSEKVQPKPVRLDGYGDPLPPGALTRLGTTRLHTLEGNVLLRRSCCIAFTKDGKELLAASVGFPVRLAEAPSGRFLRKFGSDVRAFVVCPNQPFLATRSEDGQGGVCLWDLRSGKLLWNGKAGMTDWEPAMAISRDGKTLATSSGNEICFWSVPAGARLRSITSRLNKSDRIRFLFFSSDDKALIAADEKELYIWNAQTGKEIHRGREKQNLQIAAMDYCHESSLAAVAYGNKDERRGIACIWDPASGKEVRKIVEAKASITAVAIAPNGRTVATGDFVGDVRIWNVADGRELRRCGGCLGPAQSMAFSPDGKILSVAAGWNDHTVHFWNAETAREITPSYKGHRSRVESLAFTRDGREIVSSGADGAYRVWDAKTGIERFARSVINLPDVPLPVLGGSVSPDQQNVFFYEGGAGEDGWSRTIKMVRRSGDRGRETCHSVPAPLRILAYYVAFSPDSKILACAGGSFGLCNGILLFQTATGEALDTIDAVCPMVFSSDGKMLAAISGSVGERGGSNRSIMLWNLRDKKELTSFPAAENDINKRGTDVYNMAFSPDGRLIAAAVASADGGDSRIRLWRLQRIPKSGGMLVDRLHDIPFAAKERCGLTFSPNGVMIAANGKDDVIHVWETATGKERTRFAGHEGAISSLVFSPHARSLASGSLDSTILIWDVAGDLRRDQRPATLQSGRTMELLSADMACDDAPRAARAVWRLVASGEDAVSFLKKRVRPAPPPPDAAVVAGLIAKLDDKLFTVRRQAQQKLADLGRQAEPRLYEALQGSLSVEQRSRVQFLWERSRAWSRPAGEELRTLRAIEVLEQIGSPQALGVLGRLAAGGKEAIQTQAADAALNRLKQSRGL